MSADIPLFSLATPSRLENHPTSLYVRGAAADIVIDDGEFSGQNLDFGTWFNAAPVGWWANLFGQGSLILRVHGAGSLKLWASYKGRREQILSEQIDGVWSTEVELTTQYDFMWIELESDSKSLLKSMSWDLERSGTPKLDSAARITVVVPTFQRDDDALNQVERLLGPDLNDVVGRVLLIDQGSSVARSPRFEILSEQFGDRFEFFEQDNFGGSGGYARGMIEAQRYPNDAVLLLDDDAVPEPESLRRAFVLSEVLGRNTIIGTALLSAETPTQLESLAERVKRTTFNWGQSDGVNGNDLGASSPEEWTFISPKSPVDYSGWWGTLLPVGTVSRLGLPAPFFIKWDDAEYGLRAQHLGMDTITVPGIAVWHPTWGAKGTSSSWSSWAMHRNRLTVAAVYGTGRGVVIHSLLHQIKHVLSLQYESAELWNEGIKQFKEGPGWLLEGLGSTRTAAQEFIDHFPVCSLEVTPNETTQRSIGRSMATAVVGLVLASSANRVGESTSLEYSWRCSLGMDAFIIKRDGKNELLMRDPRRARRILADTLELHLKLMRHWKGMKVKYKTAMPKAVSSWTTGQFGSKPGRAS